MKKKDVKKTFAKVLASGCSMAFVLGAMPAVNAESITGSNSYIAVSVKDEQNQQAALAAIKVMETVSQSEINDYVAEGELKTKHIMDKVAAADEQTVVDEVDVVNPYARTGLDEDYEALEARKNEQIRLAQELLSKQAQEIKDTLKVEAIKNIQESKKGLADDNAAVEAKKNEQTENAKTEAENRFAAEQAAKKEEAAKTTYKLRRGLGLDYAAVEAMKNAQMADAKAQAEANFKAEQDAKKAEAAKNTYSLRKGLAYDEMRDEQIETAKRDAEVAASKKKAAEEAKQFGEQKAAEAAEAEARKAVTDKYEEEGALKTKHIQDKVDAANTESEDVVKAAEEARAAAAEAKAAAEEAEVTSEEAKTEAKKANRTAEAAFTVTDSAYNF